MRSISKSFTTYTNQKEILLHVVRNTAMIESRKPKTSSIPNVLQNQDQTAHDSLTITHRHLKSGRRCECRLLKQTSQADLYWMQQLYPVGARIESKAFPAENQSICPLLERPRRTVLTSFADGLGAGLAPHSHIVTVDRSGEESGESVD